MQINDLKKLKYNSDPQEITDDDLEQIRQLMAKSDIDKAADYLATWLITKMYGRQVRTSLSLWVLLTQQMIDIIRSDEAAFKQAVNGDIANFKKAVNADMADFKYKVNSYGLKLTQQQQEVEKRQDDLLGRFNQAVSAITKDTEVIDARDSSQFGVFDILDSRLEFIENLIAKYVAAGFDVTIKHNQNRNPKVVVDYYEYAIGTEPNGFDTGPTGSFGGINERIVTSQVEYPDGNTCIVHLPFALALSGKVEFVNGYWYLIQGYKTLRFDLGAVDWPAANKGNGSNQAGKIPLPSQPANLTAPYNLTAKTVSDTSANLLWEDNNQ